MIYFLLDEPFSTITGLALSSTVANMMRFEHDSIVVCSEADQTWGFSEDRIHLIPKMEVVAKLKGWRFIPLRYRQRILSSVFDSFLSQIKPGDIVWCHNWQYIAEALLIPVRSKGARFIYHCHNSHALYARRTKFQCLASDAIVFNSEAMRQEVLKILPALKNTHTVHNGADDTLLYPADRQNTRSDNTPVILFAGRLVHYKGVHVLIEAMKILKDRNVKTVCRIIGSSHAGGDRSKTTPYIRSLQEECPENVQFEGFRTAADLALEYRSADIFCCPSIWQEPFGNVNIEAMASGLPVVASRVGGIPEIAAEGGVVLVEPGSAIELADVLQKLVENAALRDRIGQDALASFQRRFTWSAIWLKHRKLLDNLQTI